MTKERQQAHPQGSSVRHVPPHPFLREAQVVVMTRGGIWGQVPTTNVSIGKAMVFPVVMYGCKSWTIQKADTEEPMPSNYGAGEDS